MEITIEAKTHFCAKIELQKSCRHLNERRRKNDKAIMVKI